MATAVGTQDDINDLVTTLILLEHDAIAAHEAATVTAYERASDHTDAPPVTLAFFQMALADERRHRDWMARAAATA